MILLKIIWILEIVLSGEFFFIIWIFKFFFLVCNVLITFSYVIFIWLLFQDANFMALRDFMSLFNWFGLFFFWIYYSSVCIFFMFYNILFMTAYLRLSKLEYFNICWLSYFIMIVSFIFFVVNTFNLHLSLVICLTFLLIFLLVSLITRSSILIMFLILFFILIFILVISSFSFFTFFFKFSLLCLLFHMIFLFILCFVVIFIILIHLSIIY